LPDGRINKMADLQETKFFPQFGLTNVYYYCSYTQCLYLCVEQHQNYALLAWHTSHHFMLLDQISPIMQICWHALLAWCLRYCNLSLVKTDLNQFLNFFRSWSWRHLRTCTPLDFSKTSCYMASWIDFRILLISLSFWLLFPRNVWCSGCYVGHPWCAPADIITWQRARYKVGNNVASLRTLHSGQNKHPDEDQE
jgi:hypothetical protein